MNQITQIKSQLQLAVKSSSGIKGIFYKTGIGDYAEHDQFIGVTVPVLRKIAREFRALSLKELQVLMQSPINEERLLALFILVDQYQKADDSKKNERYQFYMRNLKHINNWNLVDSSAHLIVGAHLMHRDKKVLLTLAKSEVLWERRIAIVSTWFFIRQNSLEWTVKLAKILLHDTHDLIHKAVGWMLREAGKRDRQVLISFLDQYASIMPRTMLRYAIEKFSDEQRKVYLNSYIFPKN